MNKLRVTSAAAHDLEDIRFHIAHALQNPVAAQNVVGQITKAMRILQNFSMAGFSAAEKTGYETELRMLACRNYLIVYQVEGDTVSVARVLSGRQDYITELFGDDVTPLEDED